MVMMEMLVSMVKKIMVNNGTYGKIIISMRHIYAMLDALIL
jgi:hypothetical protein